MKWVRIGIVDTREYRKQADYSDSSIKMCTREDWGEGGAHKQQLW